MKSAKNIINSIQNSSLYVERKDINTIYALLQKKHKKLIKLMILVEDKRDFKKKLIIYCKHNIGVQELDKDSNKDAIKFVAKQISNLNPNSILKGLDEVVVKLDKFSIMARKKNAIFVENKKSIYYEKSKGKFKNSFKDSVHFEIFEKIRELILANQ